MKTYKKIIAAALASAALAGPALADDVNKIGLAVPNLTTGSRFAGPEESEVTLVGPGQTADVIIPTEESQLPSDWNQPAFVPADWMNISLGVGFDSGVVPNLRLWLKADDIVDGAEPELGTPIDAWQDRSGLGHHLQTVTDLQPRRAFLTIDKYGACHASIPLTNEKFSEMIKGAPPGRPWL